jgi:HEAT repeat protein
MREDPAMELARSGDWRERARAPVQLAAASTPAADAALARLLDDPDTAVIDAAAEALLRRGDRAGLRVILAALNNVDTEVGEHILWQFSNLHHEGLPLPDRIKEALHDPDDDVRTSAQEVLDWLAK